MNIIRPKRLEKGDNIGIVSPSSAVAAVCPRRLQRGVAHLEELGFRVILGQHAQKRHGHTAGTIEERLQDLHDMFANPEVKMIVTTIGGLNSHQLLQEIDYDLIRQNPKILLGYSDITALHAAIYAKTGLVTFLGPAVLPQFGEFGGLLPYTREYFERTLMQAEPVGYVAASEAWIEEFLRWETEDDRKRALVPNTGMKVLKPGQSKVKGRILAGNIGTLLLLAGTPYFPDVTGAILCMEEDPDETPGTVDRFFTQLRQMGVYDRIAGLMVGRFHPTVGFSENDSLEELLLTATRGYDFPIVYDADFGHTDPMMVLPNGVLAEMDATDAEKPRFAILEAAVL